MTIKYGLWPEKGKEPVNSSGVCDVTESEGQRDHVDASENQKIITRRQKQQSTNSLKRKIENEGTKGMAPKSLK